MCVRLSLALEGTFGFSFFEFCQKFQHKGISLVELKSELSGLKVPLQSLHLAVPWPLGGLLEVLGVSRDAVAAEQPERVRSKISCGTHCFL